MKYRKKPVEIDTLVFTGTNADEIFIWAKRSFTYYPDKQQLGISTLEGEMIANPGDYIIKGIKGEFYPCKPDIFKDSYEAVA